MEYLWRSYGASPEQHGSSALAALVQVACDTGPDGPTRYGGWNIPSSLSDFPCRAFSALPSQNAP